MKSLGFTFKTSYFRLTILLDLPSLQTIKMMMMMMMMMMMKCFCGMVDPPKVSNLISSRDHCQRSSPSRISDTPRAEFESAQNLSLGFVEWSCVCLSFRFSTSVIILHLSLYSPVFWQNTHFLRLLWLTKEWSEKFGLSTLCRFSSCSKIRNFH